MNLRPYQQKIVDATVAGFGQFNRQLVVAPTGSGKTVIFSHLAKATPGRTLVLAHREELIDQAIAKLYAAAKIPADKEKAEWRASLNARCVVASVQTMIRRLGRWPADHFDLVVADEAHHAISDSWQRVLNHFDRHAKVVGFTATPDRGDKRNLGNYFENVAAEVSLFELINAGFLSRIAVKSIPLQIDLSRVGQRAGDFDESDLGDALAPYLKSIAAAIRDHAAFRRTLVFLPLIATSKAFTEECIAAGLNAAHIDGTSPDRADILKRFAAGDIDMLCNAMLLTEGYDDCGIDCVVILRPTKSRPLYSQMAGRGTRTAAAKQNLLLLDFLWLHEKHNLIRPAHLVASTEEQADIITELAQKAGGESQVEFDLEGLATEAQVQREEKLRAELEAKAKRKSRFIDAMDFCLSLHQTEAAEFEPVCAWESKAVSAGQASVLERAGIDPTSIKSCGHASRVIDLIVTRAKLNLATPKQMRLMRQLGHRSPDTASFEAAQTFIGARIGCRRTPGDSRQKSRVLVPSRSAVSCGRSAGGGQWVTD